MSNTSTSLAASNSLRLIQCKAAVCWGAGEEYKVEEILVEPPKRSEVRVKMLYASLCHTDITFAKGVPIPLFPRVLGHEGVGVVESVGEEVNAEDFKAGDVVIPTFVSECKECDNCLSDKSNLCLNYPVNFSGLMLDGTSRMSTVKGNKMLYHLLSCSTWSEYMVVNVNYLLKLHNWGAETTTPPLSHASFLSCGFSTGFGSPWKEAEIERGSIVAVIGLGAVGLGAVEGARMRGAARIIGIDINEMKREKGIAFGMTDFINPGQDRSKPISQLIKDITGGMGVDYCFECSGVESFANECLEATKVGTGTAVVIGLSSSTNVEINCMSLLSGRTMKGTMFGGLRAFTDLPILIQKCMNKEMVLDELLTHEVPLIDINQAVKLLKQPDCVKVLIKI